MCNEVCLPNGRHELIQPFGLRPYRPRLLNQSKHRLTCLEVSSVRLANPRYDQLRLLAVQRLRRSLAGQLSKLLVGRQPQSHERIQLMPQVSPRHPTAWVRKCARPRGDKFEKLPQYRCPAQYAHRLILVHSPGQSNLILATDALRLVLLPRRRAPFVESDQHDNHHRQQDNQLKNADHRVFAINLRSL